MTEHIDMAQFTEAKSDQLNADDLIGAPRTITVTKVRGCEGDQPIAISYEGDNGKPWKPCKTARRVLLAIWGRNAADYVGRSLTIYRDDSVTFGGLNVGGIRISHMSHLDKEIVVVVMKSKGKKAGIKVLPLKVEQSQAGAPAPDAATKWANGYIARLATLDTIAALDTFAAEKAGKLAELRDARPELADEVLAAHTKRQGELQADAFSVPDDDKAFQ